MLSSPDSALSQPATKTSPRKARPQNISPPRGLTRDRATRYALQVTQGKIIAGPHVRAACHRHLADLETAHERGFHYDPKRAAHAIGFCQDLLKLNGGEYEGEPFDPNGWQSFVLGSLYGWVDAQGGLRRFRVAYIETAKGSGKSPLAAAIGLICLMADNEQRAEIYAAATKRDQAQILFKDAVAMVDQSPDISPLLVRSGSKGKEWNLAYHPSNSYFRPISSDNAQSGPRPHVGLIDEFHEHSDGTVVEMMRAGFKFRSQPLLFIITNSGVDKNSICGAYHDYGIEVVHGIKQDDRRFAYICGLDEGDDPIQDESCWPKANPSLSKGNPAKGIPDGIPGYRFLREQVVEARGMPSKEATVRRLHFCQWVQAANPWIGYEVWKACEPQDDFDESLLIGRRCWAGLDLSSTTDLTACVYLFEPTAADPWWRIKPRFWLPAEGLAAKEEKDRVPYLAWKSAGWLRTTPGKAINKAHVARQIADDADLYDLQGIAYDRWRIADFNSMMDQEDISLPPMVAYGQGYKDMAPAVDALETLLVEATIKHDGNPCLTWHAANAITVADPAGNRKLDKSRATGRIDGMVALLMARGIAATPATATEPGMLFG